MISFAQAVRLAKDFLSEAGVGILWCTLDEATLKDNKWMIKFDYKLMGSRHKYTVELDAEKGSVITYKREVLAE